MVASRRQTLYLRPYGMVGAFRRLLALFGVAVAIVAALLCIVDRAGAQTTPAPPPVEAVELYQQGRELYQQGRYRDALVAMQRAAALDPTSANLAYNVARVHELLGEIDEAIRSYQRYLDLLPQTEEDERTRVRGIMRRLDGARRELTPPHPTEPEPASALRAPESVPIVVREHGVADGWFFATAGTGVLALIGGTICGIHAMSLQTDASNFVVGRDGSLSQHDAIVSNSNSFALLADIGIFAGAALALTSGLLYFVRTRDVEHRPDPAGPAVVPEVSVSAHGFTLSLRGTL